MKFHPKLDTEWREVSDGFELLSSKGFRVWAKQERQNIYSTEIVVYNKNLKKYLRIVWYLKSFLIINSVVYNERIKNIKND